MRKELTKDNISIAAQNIETGEIQQLSIREVSLCNESADSAPEHYDVKLDNHVINTNGYKYSIKATDSEEKLFAEFGNIVIRNNIFMIPVKQTIDVSNLNKRFNT